MRLTASEDIDGTSIGNYDGYTNTFDNNTMSVNTAVTITEKENKSCAYLTETGYIKFPSGSLSTFCLTCYVYVDADTRDYARLLKLSGENGNQGELDIVLSSTGIGNVNNPYNETLATWVHLKVNYDVVGTSVTREVFIDDVFTETITESNSSINTDNFVIGQQHQSTLKSKFYIYDFKLYKGIHL
jgi:hypothetical protein